jgi:hypothetical protein
VLINTLFGKDSGGLEINQENYNALYLKINSQTGLVTFENHISRGSLKDYLYFWADKTSLGEKLTIKCDDAEIFDKLRESLGIRARFDLPEIERNFNEGTRVIILTKCQGYPPISRE